MSSQDEKCLKCVAMPKDEITIQFNQIFEKLTEIARDSREVKKMMQDSIVEVARIRMEVDFLKRQREEDKLEVDREINIIHESIRRRDKKVMWVVGIFLALGTFLTSAISIFTGK